MRLTEEDLLKYTALGADLVIYSGAKAIEGPSAGMVIGKDPLVSWVRLQSQGIGRSMKIGKENVLGFVQAVDDYLIHGSESGESMKKEFNYLSKHWKSCQVSRLKSSKIQLGEKSIVPASKSL